MNPGDVLAALMSVEVLSTTPLRLGVRKKLFDVSAYEPGYFHDFDVSADGTRFLFIRAEPGRGRRASTSSSMVSRAAPAGSKVAKMQRRQ